MNNTLIKHDGYVTAVLNQPCLEPGVLHYVVEYQINDSTYPDAHKRIFQEFTSDIELCKGNGDTLDIDVQAMFGDTIDDKFNSYDASILALGTAEGQLSAAVLSIQEVNSVQDASINRIEEIISTIDGGTSGSIDRLDTSVNALSLDVSALNGSVNTLATEQETMSQNLSNVTNTVNDVSTRVDGFEAALANKADVSVLGNYYTTGETYTKTEVDRAIADAALDGSLPAGVVVDADYVHTDNNYSNEDKAKVRDFDLTGYPTNSSISANYATKAELQSVDDNHPTNASVNATYLKKVDLPNELTDYVKNASLNTKLEDYPTKNDVSTVVYESDLGGILSGYATNASVSDNYVHWLYANENYVSYENFDEMVYNLIENSQRTDNKIDEVISDSSTISDISTNVSDVSVKVIDVSLKVQDISTRLGRDYLTTTDLQRDYITNASVAANYTTKDEFNEVWTTGFLTQDSADSLYLTLDSAQTDYATKTELSDYATSDDISTFKSIVFLTQNEYDTLVSNDNVDANTVYMIDSSNPVNYLTANDVSIYVTNASLAANYPTNSSLATNYATKSEVETATGNIYYELEQNYAEASQLENIYSYINEDVSTYNSNTYATKNDVSAYITSNDVSTKLEANDVSIYATTAYVDQQLGNIQNILATI